LREGSYDRSSPTIGAALADAVPAATFHRDSS